MLIVMSPARIASSDWKSYKCYGLWYALSGKTSSVTPDFFTFLKKKICTWEFLGANVLKVDKNSQTEFPNGKCAFH